MRAILLALLLSLLLAAPASASSASSAPLTVAVTYPGDGSVIISYAPPIEQWMACALRGPQLLGCDLEGVGAIRFGPGGQDARMRVRPGDVVEVRVWNADGEVIAQGAAIAGHQVALPMLR